MVRLTAEMVRTAPQGLNCLGDWELDLRGRRLVDIAALAPVAGRYDAIDLSRNFLPALSGFPFAPRLRHLHVPRNRIAAIGPGFADAVPALESLLLTDNGLASLAAARLSEELARLPCLTLLCLRGNPVTRTPNYRLAVIAALPGVRVLDFVRVRDAERRAARRFFGGAMAVDGGGGERAPASAGEGGGGGGAAGGDGGRGTPRAAASAADGGGGGGGGAAASVSVADRERLRRMIAAAESIEEVDALEAALKSGDVAAVLGPDAGSGGGSTAAAAEAAAADVSGAPAAAAADGPARGAAGGGSGGGGARTTAAAAAAGTPAAPATATPIRTAGAGGWQANGDGDRHRDGGGRGGVAGGGEGEDMEDDDGGGRANGGAAGGADGGSKASG